MKKIVIDTSIFIESVRGRHRHLLSLIDEREAKRNELIISPVVYLELWSGTSMSNFNEIRTAEDLLKPLTVIPMTIEIAQKAGELRRLFGIEAMDAIIAATAINENAQIATLNKKHFKKIPGITLWRPAQL